MSNLGKPSTGLAKPSTGLGKKSIGGLGKKSLGQGALDKASVISLVKKSLGVTSVATSFDSDELPWHALGAEDVVTELASSASNGLASDDAKRRLTEFGPNRMSEVEKPGFFKRLWDKVRGASQQTWDWGMRAGPLSSSQSTPGSSAMAQSLPCSRSNLSRQRFATPQRLSRETGRRAQRNRAPSHPRRVATRAFTTTSPPYNANT